MVKPTNIEEAIARVEDWQGKEISYEVVSGGITNPNFKVFVDGTAYFLKIPGAGTDFIDRNICHAANMNASESGAGPKVFYYYEDTGVEIFEWLDGYRNCNYGDVYDKHTFTKIAEAIKFFHKRESEPLPLVESAFDQTRDMMARAAEGRYMPPMKDKLDWFLAKCEEAFDHYGVENTICHNDLYTNNYMLNEETGDLKIIDWEYASMNDPYYDMAAYASGNYLTEAMDCEMIRIYNDGVMDDYGLARLKLNKIVADIKWGYWALSQNLTSDVDFDYMNWYNIQMDPLKWKMNDPRLDIWFNLLNGRSPFYTK